MCAILPESQNPLRSPGNNKVATLASCEHNCASTKEASHTVHSLRRANVHGTTPRFRTALPRWLGSVGGLFALFSGVLGHFSPKLGSTSHPWVLSVAARPDPSLESGQHLYHSTTNHTQCCCVTACHPVYKGTPTLSLSAQSRQNQVKSGQFHGLGARAPQVATLLFPGLRVLEEIKWPPQDVRFASGFVAVCPWLVAQSSNRARRHGPNCARLACGRPSGLSGRL